MSDHAPVSMLSAQPRPLTWAQRPWAVALRDWAFRAVARPALRVWCRPMRVDGIEHLESLSGPAILVANHSSHFDTPLILCALPPAVRRRVAVAAARDYFFARRSTGLLASLAVNAFPLDRRRGAGSLALPRGLLRRGWSVLVYPEGTRSTTGDVGPFHTGVVRLAAATGAPVIPLWVEGAHECLPKGRVLPRPASAAIRIGRPRRYGPDAAPRTSADALRACVLSLATGRDAPDAAAKEGGLMKTP